MSVASVMVAMTRSFPPHRGQRLISIPKTRLSLVASITQGKEKERC